MKKLIFSVTKLLGIRQVLLLVRSVYYYFMHSITTIAFVGFIIISETEARLVYQLSLENKTVPILALIMAYLCLNIYILFHNSEQYMCPHTSFMEKLTKCLYSFSFLDLYSDINLRGIPFK